MNRFCLPLLLQLLILPFLVAQTPLAGVINQYAAVTAIDEDCLSRISLSDTTGFRPGDMALIIQMQGAEIDINNDDSFGRVRSLRGTGSYERIRIDSVGAQQVFYRKKLLNNYEPQIGRVQLITIPQFTEATVTDTLRPAAWDGRKGGVLILEVEGTLELQAPVIASAMGFRGGAARSNLPNDCSWLTLNRRQYYDKDSWRGAMKGEGIALYVLQREAGRGPQANGGGGGNDHNSGGGGGGQAHTGGAGGENNEPSAFGCQGRNPGRGGRELEQAVNRLFMGGGGGAGHGNNDNASDGGQGGGIIFLAADRINSNNQPIAANGASVPEIVGDGAGGGGAAGTIVLLTENLEGFPKIELNGGNGGDVNNNNNNRCFGPGGGGSPGFLFLNPNINNTDYDLRSSAGKAGRSYNSSSCNAGSNGATASTDMARLQRIETLLQSDITLLPTINNSVDSLTVCENGTNSWQPSANGFGLSFQWQWNPGNGWVNIPTDSVHQANAARLTLDQVPALLDGTLYRLRISDVCGQTVFSSPTLLQVLPQPVAAFDLTVNANTIFTSNTSRQATAYSWTFGDGSGSTEPNPDHTYSANGTYTVQLIASNLCGADTLTRTVIIDQPAAPVAAFSATPQSGCAPLQVRFTDLSSSVVENRSWQFPGGSPATSTDAAPLVTYTTQGSYDVYLNVSNLSGSDELERIDYITVLDKPIAGFTPFTNGTDLSLNNNSTNASSYRWDFGDGQQSTLAEPSHTYASAGQYTVQLVALNDCGSDTLTQVVQVSKTAAPTAQFSSTATSGCVPFAVTFTDQSGPAIQQRRWEFEGGDPTTSDARNPLILYNQAGTYAVRLEVSNVAGTDQLEELAYVFAVDRPKAQFDLELRGDSLFLNNFSTGAQEFNWNFGDGNTSTEVSPVHVYQHSGTYRVTLVAKNDWCSSVVSVEITILTSSSIAIDASAKPIVFPNPTRDRVWIRWPEAPQTVLLRLHTITGQKVLSRQLSSHQLFDVDLNGIERGIYLLELKTEEQSWWEKLIIN